MGYYEEVVKSMSEEELDLLLGGRSPWLGYKYKPIFSSSLHERLGLGEEFVRKMEEEGDEEEVLKKMLKKGLRQPGTTRVRVEAYLKRALERAEAEGRL